MQVLDLPPGIPVQSMEDVMVERGRQILDFGHTPENDARLPVATLPIEATRYLNDVLDEMMRRRDGWQDRARRKLAKAGALTIAAIDRLDLEPHASAAHWPSPEGAGFADGGSR